MKKLYAFTLLLIISNQFLKAQSIKNADFESGDTLGWRFETPVTYGGKDSGYKCSVIKDPSSPNQNFVMQFASTYNSQWCQLKQYIPYKTIDSIERIKLSALIKTEGMTESSTGEAGIMLRTFWHGKTLGLTTKHVHHDTGWSIISLEVLIARQTDSLLLFCGMAGTEGKAFFDNIKIEKIALGNLKQTPEAKAYLDTAINIIGKHALYKDSVDFNALIKQAYLLAADTKKTADCYTAIRYVLQGLGDHHSFFLTPEQANNLNRKEDTTMVLPSGKKINNNIGYLKIPPCGAINKAMEILYADRLRQVIESIDNKQITGWIVDNRDNTGGNCWPMLLGVGPVLGDGIFNRTKSDGKVSNSISYVNGVIRNKDTMIIKTNSVYKLYNPFPKVAVLMNEMTASSGESVLLSFKNRQATRLIGEASYGLSTSNADFTLSDGAMIFVCAGKQTDRLGNEYGGKIYPDETVTDKPNTKTDEVIDAAAKWLNAK